MSHLASVLLGVRRRAVGGGLATVALLAAGLQPATAQSLDQSVTNALNANCAALGGSLGASLAALCAAAGGAPSSAGGGTTASDTGVAADGEGKVKKRLKDLRGEANATTGMSAGDTTFDIGALSGFVSLDYQNIDKDTTALTSGFQSNKFGGTVGVDHSFGRFVIGAAANYGYTDGDFDAGGGDFETHGYGGLIYASFLATEQWFIDGVAGYTRKDTTLSRNAAFAVNGGNIAAGTEDSDPDANEFQAGISSGYDFTYNAITFGPRVSVNYTRTEIDTFRESGNTGLELVFDDQTFDSLTASFGANASMAISTSFGVLVPQVSADYIHEFANDQQTLTARFAGDLNASPTILRFQTDSPDRDYFGLGAGLVMVLPNGLSPYANYRALLGDTLKTTQTVTAGLRFEF